IYFLAINHRKAVLGRSKELRRAMAFAMNRAQILKECFGEEPEAAHRPLNGPYPPGSWACNPAVPASLDDLTRAKAQQAHGPVEKLTLKYPDGDPSVKKACEMIQSQIRALALDPPIQLELVAKSPRDLKHDVEEAQQFDL